MIPETRHIIAMFDLTPVSLEVELTCPDCGEVHEGAHSCWEPIEGPVIGWTEDDIPVALVLMEDGIHRFEPYVGSAGCEYPPGTWEMVPLMMYEQHKPSQQIIPAEPGWFAAVLQHEHVEVDEQAQAFLNGEEKPSMHWRVVAQDMPIVAWTTDTNGRGGAMVVATQPYGDGRMRHIGLHRLEGHHFGHRFYQGEFTPAVAEWSDEPVVFEAAAE